MPETKPRAFLSYVQQVDRHDNRAISTLRERLEGELQVQTGEPFPIFQDWKDIGWGQDWERRIESSLEEVVFLIPLLTEGFFKSQACRRELTLFAERERKLGRDDLILPLLYTPCPSLDRGDDPLVAILRRHNWESWIDRRHEPPTSPEFGRAITRLALRLVEATSRARTSGSPTSLNPTAEASAPAVSEATPTPRTAEQPRMAASGGSSGPLKDPPIMTVDAMHRGDYASLAEAAQRAAPGSRILVYPGVYQGPVTLDKPLEIVGQGELGEVIVESDENVVRFTATMGRIANLVLRQKGDQDNVAVDIARGRLVLEGCEVTSSGSGCIDVYGSADPLIRRCRVHHGKQGGIFINEQGRGTIEDNDIFANALTGIVITTGAEPVVKGNRINHNEYEAIWVYGGGGGTFEGNDLTENKGGPWDIAEDCLPRVTRENNKEK